MEKYDKCANYRVLTNTIPIPNEPHVDKPTRATTYMHSKGMRALICGEKWLVVSGGNSNNNVLSIYELLDCIWIDIFMEASGMIWSF